VGALKGFGWFRTAPARRAVQQDPAEMGTAFGLDACFGASAPDVDRVMPGTGAPRADAALSPPGVQPTGFWRRLGGRLAPGR
jgi:hypothetical protein